MRTILAVVTTLAISSLSFFPTNVDSKSVSKNQTRTFKQKKFIRSAKKISNQYLVVLKDGVAGPLGEFSIASETASTLADTYGGNVKKVFRHALNGFSADMSEDQALALADDDRVAYVEEDGIVTIAATQSGATWGLDRIDQRDRPLNSSYTYNFTGSGVNAYVVDTGIRRTHTEFAGRAVFAFDSIGDGNGQSDCNGHGTHVAGTIGGRTYGVAKNSKLYAVRVLNCSGSGAISGVIAGLDWVARNHIKPAVANLSLGTNASTTVDNAVRNCITAGVTMVVAAGNSNADACNTSPARLPEAITVGSSTSSDARSSFSNYGSCLDIFAPGSSITSASSSGDSATTTMSGTSMASPHVAGAVALYLESNPAALPAQVWSAMKAAASSNKITNIGTGSPNLLLYSLFTPDGGSTPCTNCQRYTGTITTAGQTQYHPNGNYYYSSISGAHVGTLNGPAGTNFDLLLYRWNGSAWEIVGRGQTTGSDEQVTYSGTPGYYIWGVWARTGTGAYDLTIQKP
jgi:aqualysin 1